MGHGVGRTLECILMKPMKAFLLIPLIIPLIIPLSGDAFAAGYAGAEACRKCHPAEFAGQSASAHARTLAHAAPPQPGEWAFGAGVQAVTFVSRVDRENYLEHGETWYRALDGYDVTPGQDTRAGVRFRTFDPAGRILRCFACHSTGPLTLGPNDSIVPNELGVRCEICHGPAADHARDPARNHPRNPGRLTAAAMNTFCGQCHGLLITGDPLADLRDPRTSRNQTLLLAASACFRKSQGRLNCVTCHPPHAASRPPSAAYDKACRGCHAAPRHTVAIAGQACAQCHMPAVRLQRLVFQNHRIGIYSPADPVSPVSAKARP